MSVTKYLVIGLFLVGCGTVDPNLDYESGKEIFEQYDVIKNPISLSVNDTMYVPIYSDIYSETKHVKFLLTATLSIRNTSLRDSIYIQKIDYYDTFGKLVQEYLDHTILLKPMQSIEYVVEEKDTAGGTGANFVIYWGSNATNLNPIFEGIMISTNGQQGISFSTKGISISD